MSSEATDPADRLAEIKSHPHQVFASDTNWLIDEVERLRAKNEQLQDDVFRAIANEDSGWVKGSDFDALVVENDRLRVAAGILTKLVERHGGEPAGEQWFIGSDGCGIYVKVSESEGDYLAAVVSLLESEEGQ